MVDTYTNPTGTTTPGLQTSSLMDTINSLPLTPEAKQAMQGYVQSTDQAAAMQANLPQYQQAQQTSQLASAQVPQATDYYGKQADLMKMFTADHQLSQQFTNPSLQQTNPAAYQPSDTPTFGSVGLPYLPEMTLGNVNQPFKGFTDPYNAAAAESAQVGGIIGMLNNLGGLIGYNTGVANKNAQANVANYSGLINAALTRASGYTNLLSTLSSLGLTGLNTNPVLLNNSLATDAMSGMTLSDMMKKYGTQMKADDIYTLYNRYSKWGPAAETPQQLSSKFGVTSSVLPKLPTSDEPKVANTKSTLQTIDQIMQGMQDDKALQDIIGNPLKKTILEKLMKSNMGSVAQSMFGITDEGMNALSAFLQIQGQGDRDMIGGRLSGYMLGVFAPAFPNIGQSISTNISLLNQLKKRITGGADIYAKNNKFGGWQSLPGFEDYNTSGDSSSSDPLGIL